jgi:putative NIF3 family GTP cyclohydrolase 1 type 2
MKRAKISRRRFAAIAAAAGVTPIGIRGAQPLTAEVVFRRIQTELGGDWPEAGPDSLKAGDASAEVRGIATTAMATLDVLKQAVKANANLVLTYEPTFYGRADGRAAATPPGGRGPAALGADDPVVRAKREFIQKNSLVVYRLRDHWQSRKQSEMVTGLAGALGWSSRRVKPDDALYDIPPVTAEEAATLIRTKLNLRGGLRAVGDRKATVRRVLIYPGSMPPSTMWQRYSEVDLIVAGEVREWENTLYAADIFTAREKRALITIGRVASEDPGMRLCAEWVKTVAKEVPATWIGAGDPYWRAS